MTTLCIDELARTLKQRWGWPAGADHVPPVQLQPGDTIIGRPGLAAPSFGPLTLIRHTHRNPALTFCTSDKNAPSVG